jgi:mannose-6-phosphate isomerase-like protein (cupin superfamily)
MSAETTDWGELARHARIVLENAVAGSLAPEIANWPLLRNRRAVAAQSLAVLRWLPEATHGAPPGPLRELATLVHQAVSDFAWRQSYRAPQVSAQFLERYGWCELFGLSGPLPCPTLACGFLLLGPETFYPSHGHRAAELYVPLSGTAEWQCADEPFRTRAPGELIAHRPYEPHAMRTQSQPLLALYLWHGAGLAESSQMHAD